MRVVLQRVSEAAVCAGAASQSIGQGLTVLFGAGEQDDSRHMRKLAQRTACLRIFEDSEGKMNLSAADKGYEILVVPNFTLFADTSRGLRPSFIKAAQPDKARMLFEMYVQAVREFLPPEKVKQGYFGESMALDMSCDGPVTIIIDTKDWEKDDKE